MKTIIAALKANPRVSDYKINLTAKEIKISRVETEVMEMNLAFIFELI